MTFGASLPAGRSAEIASIIDDVTLWASGRPDVAGLLLVGSCARGTARPSSDVDFVLLTHSAWDSGPAIGEPTLTRSWGPITERRFVTPSGLEVELNVGNPSWAAVTPVDPGTLRVVGDGARSLYDPAGLLAVLLDACGGATP
jgi:uncharacterized protein